MSDDVRAEILRHAADEFARNGFRGARLDAVAERLGVTRQALYYYYPSKAAILADLRDRFHERLDAALTGAAPGGFDAMLAAHARVVAEAPAEHAIVTQEPSDRWDAVVRRLVAAYADGVRAGELRADVAPEAAVAAVAAALGAVTALASAPPETVVDLLGTGYRRR